MHENKTGCVWRYILEEFPVLGAKVGVCFSLLHLAEHVRTLLACQVDSRPADQRRGVCHVRAYIASDIGIGQDCEAVEVELQSGRILKSTAHVFLESRN